MLVAHPINWIDATGVEMFGQVQTQLAERGITLHVVGIKLPVEQALKTAGLLPEGPHLRLYRTEAEALQAMAALSAPAPETPQMSRSDTSPLRSE
jgi:SulP family sulfate permease